MNVTIEDGVGSPPGVINDAWIYDNAPLGNYGAHTWAWIRNEPDAKANMLMYANLSAISGTVTSAYWGLDIIAGFFNMTVKARTVLIPWGEGTKTGQAAGTGESSWNYSEKPDEWTTPGCLSDGNDRLATIEGSYTYTEEDPDVVFTVSNASVQRMIDTPSTNYGWVFCNDSEEIGQYANMRTSESSPKPFFYMEYTGAGIPLPSRARMVNL